MKKYLILIIFVLLGIVGYSLYLINKVNEKWKVAEANVKAYSNELSASNNKSTALLLTMDQLQYFNDSILVALDLTRKELKIKDKNLKALLVVYSSFSRNDTLVISQVDTLFKEPSLAIDTLIGDKWYSLRLGLKYPSTISVQPEFNSEKHIIVFSKKETVNPPKKCIILRWFLKKHNVLTVVVLEKNPYVDRESSKYVEIIK